jgi:hypothetical protein
MILLFEIVGGIMAIWGVFEIYQYDPEVLVFWHHSSGWATPSLYIVYCVYIHPKVWIA